MAKIRLTPAAVTDLQEIKEYISKELYNPMAADRIINKIINDYTLLETSPFMGGLHYHPYCLLKLIIAIL